MPEKAAPGESTGPTPNGMAPGRPTLKAALIKISRGSSTWMALWGTADSIYSPGTVTIDYASNTITGTGTSFRAATVGSVITIGVGATFGEAVIASITDETTLGIATIRYLSGAATPTAVEYTISQKPVYTLADADTQDSAIRGVDQFETGAVRGTKYEVAHGGWVGVHTYVDQH